MPSLRAQEVDIHISKVPGRGQDYLYLRNTGMKVPLEYAESGISTSKVALTVTDKVVLKPGSGRFLSLSLKNKIGIKWDEDSPIDGIIEPVQHGGGLITYPTLVSHVWGILVVLEWRFKTSRTGQ